MIKRVHEHIISELQQNSKTDTIFIVAAIFLNLLTLAINSSIAEESRGNGTFFIVMLIFALLVMVVNVVVVLGLSKGKQTKSKLLNGLLKMYKDQGVDGYYDSSLLSGYDTRYNLFILVVVFMGLISIVVPFVLR